MTDTYKERITFSSKTVCNCDPFDRADNTIKELKSDLVLEKGK